MLFPRAFSDRKHIREANHGVPMNLPPRTRTTLPIRALMLILLAAWTLWSLPAHAAAVRSHYLGPTGLTGITSATRIVVTAIEKGSPADGKIACRTTIVGAEGKRFHDNARREIAGAINDAETADAGGMLSLMVEDPPGTTGKAASASACHTVDLQLQVLGRYSATAPYHDQKTDAIITRAADYLVSTGQYKAGSLHLGWLGLMATGEKKYIDLVKRELPREAWAHPDPKQFDEMLAGKIDLGFVGWYWGYDTITLAEYYLLTHDKSVLPGIKTYAVALARGQDPSGRWGHRMATPKFDGRLPGYAQMNQPSLSDFMGLLLARKCGVHEPVVDQAIERSHTAFARYIGKGTFPYGNHPPRTSSFNNNGMSASGAICMELYGDKKGAAFFSKQAATSYDDLEIGHATYYFNVLWTPLGTNLCGPEATKAFFRKSLWLQTLYRAWNGRFTFDGRATSYGNSTGSALLAYCLPRHVLYITGKDADKSLWLDRAQTAKVMQLSQIDYDAKSADQLIALMNSWAPQVVLRATAALHKQHGQFLPRLLELMAHGTKTQKLAVIRYFGENCPPDIAQSGVKDLGGVLRNQQEDAEVRAAAANSLALRGPEAYKYYNDMLKFVVEDKPGDVLHVNDEVVGRALVTMCHDPFAAGLVTEKGLFYKAVIKLANNKRQVVRANGMELIEHMPLKDFHLVADTVKHVVLNRDPTFTSYHNPGTSVLAGEYVLAHLNIKDGLPWAFDMLHTPDGKFSFKIRAFLRILKAYGPNAKPALDRIKADPKLLKSLDSKRWQRLWKAMVKAIDETARPANQLITFEQAKAMGMK